MAQLEEARTVAILGTGDVGLSLARGVLLKGEKVIMGTRDPEADGKYAELYKSLTDKAADDNDKKKLEEILNKNGKNLFVLDTFENASSKSSVIFLAISWNAVDDVCKKIAKHVNNKPIFDLVNPLEYAKDKDPSLAVGHKTSAGEIIQQHLKDGHVVKCWNCITNRYFCNGGRDNLGGTPTMFYCGNNDNAKKICKEYLNAWNWKDYIDIGDITKSRYLEPLAMIWIDHLFHQGYSPTHAFSFLRVGKSNEKEQKK